MSTTIPFVSSLAVIPGTNNNVFQFKQIPDYTGEGEVQVTISGFNKITDYSILIYNIAESNFDSRNLNLVNVIKCSNDTLYKCNTGSDPKCGYYAVLVETSKIGKPASVLNSDNLDKLPGIVAQICAPPYASSHQIELIENGIKKWIDYESNDTFQNHEIASATPVFPNNVSDFVNQLVKYGVPKNYFTPEIENVLQMILDIANKNAKQLLTACRAAGSMTAEVQLEGTQLGATESWKCKFCKVGFAVTVAACSVVIVTAVVPLLPELAAATAGLASILQTWFMLSSATATLLATGIAGSLTEIAKKAAVKVSDVVTILPQYLCENLGACSK